MPTTNPLLLRAALLALTLTSGAHAQTATAATDPVIAKGEMVAEYHKYYGSAAQMPVRETHEKITKRRF